METSGTDMLSDSDNRATISPLHLAVSTAFIANVMAGLLKIPHICLCRLKQVPRTLRTFLIQRVLECTFVMFCF